MDAASVGKHGIDRVVVDCRHLGRRQAAHVVVIRQVLIVGLGPAPAVALVIGQQAIGDRIGGGILTHRANSGINLVS